MLLITKMCVERIMISTLIALLLLIEADRNRERVQTGVVAKYKYPNNSVQATNNLSESVLLKFALHCCCQCCSRSIIYPEKYRRSLCFL